MAVTSQIEPSTMQPYHGKGTGVAAGKSIELVAALVGYADGVTLRALLRRRLGRGVRELPMTD